VQTPQRPSAVDDSGLGIVEIVVSMFLLALLAVAFLPLLIQGMMASVTSATVATASQLLNQQLDAVRAVPPNCADVRAFADVTVLPTTDPRGTEFQPDSVAGACPASYPGVVRVEVRVTEVGDVRPLAEAVTLVYVESATAPTPTPVPTP
jgi:type II secretory pathway pseudopilin PulG